jgi:hypothetical protein
MTMGEMPFTVVIDDPLANTFVKEGTENGMTIDSVEYKRRWDQNEEYGLLRPIPEEKNHFPRDVSVKKVISLIKHSSKIAAFTGAGISVGILLCI